MKLLIATKQDNERRPNRQRNSRAPAFSPKMTAFLAAIRAQVSPAMEICPAMAVVSRALYPLRDSSREPNRLLPLPFRRRKPTGLFQGVAEWPWHNGRLFHTWIALYRPGTN